MKALSIKQPWAWLIVNGYKPVENRSWKTKFRGRILIHAGKTINPQDYLQAKELCDSLGIKLPKLSQFKLGGIVGSAVISDCVEHHDSPFFFGKYGFVLTSAKKCKYIPYKGQLSFFEVDI